jgi:hypothetical protein
LFGVASLDSPPAIPAPADPDLEPGGGWRRHGGQVGLELLGVTLVFDLTATVRTATGQWSVQGPLRVRRCQAMTMPAVCLTALAARSSRLVARLVPATERGGLTLTRTPGVLQQSLQLGDPLIPLRQRCLQPCHHRLQAHHDLRQARFGIAA